MNHNAIYKSGFKALTMIPALADNVTQDEVLAYADYLHGLNGFETLAVYKLHDVSGPTRDGLYDWIIEAFYNSVNTTEGSVFTALINCPMVNKQWELSIHRDYVQMASENWFANV